MDWFGFFISTHRSPLRQIVPAERPLNPPMVTARACETRAHNLRVLFISRTWLRVGHYRDRLAKCFKARTLSLFSMCMHLFVTTTVPMLCSLLQSLSLYLSAGSHWLLNVCKPNMHSMIWCSWLDRKQRRENFEKHWQLKYNKSETTNKCGDSDVRGSLSGLYAWAYGKILCSGKLGTMFVKWVLYLLLST